MILKLPEEQLKDVPHPNVLNMGLTASNLDIGLGIYFPKPISQINAETAGSQNSPIINQDIVIAGNKLKDVNFLQVTDNTLLDFGGTAVINPVVNSKISNALRYQGYDVTDGGFDGV